jgi:hypothetical protein
MKLSVSSQQHEYFQAQHLIVFEGVLTSEEISELEANIDKALAVKLKRTVDQVWREPADKIFLAGLNLWQSSIPIRKLITSTRLSSVASQLLNQKPMRMGYDLYIKPGNAHFLEPLRPFNEICCIQGLLGGILICLEGQKAGNMAVFGPELQIDASKIFDGNPFLLVTYAHPMSLFIRRVSDPMYLVLQEIGYGYGDRLSDALSPIIYK